MNLACLIGAVLAVWLLVGILGFVLRRIFLTLERSPGLEKAAKGIQVLRRNVRVLLLLFAVIATLGIGGYGGWLWYEGEDLRDWGLTKFEQIPDDFWMGLAIGAAMFLGLAIAAWFLLRYVRRWLQLASEKAKAYDGVKANDESVERFFHALQKVASRATWITVLAYGSQFLGMPTDVVDTVFLALRVYLIVAIGLLVWRAIDAVIESLDALSHKYSEPDNILRHYDTFRHLVPLLRRCVEYVLMAFVATLAIEQIDWVANLAVWGPRLIRIIGIIFISRVIVEVVNLVVETMLVKRPKLEPDQRKRRQTIVPLIESILKYLVYINAAFLILEQIGIDPTPFLAGAGIVGLAIGLGAQGLVNDMVSGFFILFEDYYLVGDYIGALNAEGTVERIDLRTTRIRDTSGRLHILRNGQIESVVNYSKVYTFAVVDVGIAYESDLDRAFEALVESGRRLGEHNGDVLQATTVLGLQDFGESELTIRTVTRVKPGAHLQVERDLRKIIKIVFDERDIEIPYARRVLIMQTPEGDDTAISSVDVPPKRADIRDAKKDAKKGATKKAAKKRKKAQ